MDTQSTPQVAILLATYNGATHIASQIASLKENVTAFTLHWLDDGSTDNTRDAVRAAAVDSGIVLCEWHQPGHQGVPGAFFQLLECVEADVYLFCDQDDIWQPGKIDATVSNLLPDRAEPALCFSDPLLFDEEEPGVLRPLSSVFRYAKLPEALQESRLFMSACVCGNTVGFTRPLRDLFLRHKDVARAYARMHDSWMYLIAVASGKAHMLTDVPTTLYRRHGENFSTVYLNRKGTPLLWTWRLQHLLRKRISRHAEGFIRAAATLPPGPKLDQLLTTAKIVATLDRRQSLLTLARLAHRRAMWPRWRDTIWLAAACLWADARA